MVLSGRRAPWPFSHSKVSPTGMSAPARRGGDPGLASVDLECAALLAHGQPFCGNLVPPLPREDHLPQESDQQRKLRWRSRRRSSSARSKPQAGLPLSPRLERVHNLEPLHLMVGVEIFGVKPQNSCLQAGCNDGSVPERKAIPFEQRFRSVQDLPGRNCRGPYLGKIANIFPGLGAVVPERRQLGAG